VKFAGIKIVLAAWIRSNPLSEGMNILFINLKSCLTENSTKKGANLRRSAVLPVLSLGDLTSEIGSNLLHRNTSHK